MRSVLPLVLLRTVVLIAMAASAALLHDYTRPLPAFCEHGGGCEQVRQSAFASFLGVPQPVIGLLGLLALFAATFATGPRRKRLVTILGSLAGLAGLSFLGVQALVVQAFCHLCVVVDVGAVVAAALAWLVPRSTQKGDQGGVPAVAWGGLAALAVAAPFLFAAARPAPPVPAAIARLWTPGRVNVVELSDFECPYCRQLHPELTKAMSAYGDRVGFARVTVPLRSHRHARVASQDFLCARTQGKGEAMAHELFGTEDLSLEGRNAAAKHAGLDLSGLELCRKGSEVNATIDEHLALARDSGFRGLPTLWIGKQMLIGAVTADEIKQAIDVELDGGVAASMVLPQTWVWSGLVAVFLAAAGIAIWRAPRNPDVDG